jgi:hypothetical protein
MRPEEIARREWTHVDGFTGKTLTWCQENEDAVSSKSEAVAMLQRTIDFWFVKLRDEIISSVDITVPAATDYAKRTVLMNVEGMIQTKRWSFASRYGVTVNDFNLDIAG